MIARMSKYDFILYAGQSDDFIERLRELGLVDVTCRGWEPSEGDRQLVTAIEGRTKALAALERFRSSEHFDAAARPFASGDEAYERYGRTAQERAALRTEIGQTEKAAEEARPWGDFSAGTLQRLARRGVVLRFFTAQRDAFEKSRDAWNEQAPVEVIHETSSTVWFVAVSHEGAELSFDAQEVKAPAMTAHDAEAKVASLRSRLSATDAEMSRAAASAALIERDCNRLREELQRVKVTATAEAAADGTLLVMEGWAERETSDRVDALLDEYPNVLYIKSDPTPEDETPVKLKNNRFARIFEMVGDMYARPKYGTMDLTPFFAPFYMLFFGICPVEKRRTPVHVLCDWAHLALKTVKGSDLTNYAFYDGELRARLLDENNIKDQMHEALEKGQFVLYLQPKVEISSGRIVGAEALARWRHPTDGLILPGRFVPLFERNGFIVRFDEYIWEQTCKMLRLWLNKGYRPTPVSINVSRMHFNDDHFCGKLLALTDSTLAKLRAMTDAEFAELELYPDFDE